jgi:hypothetical protein
MTFYQTADGRAWDDEHVAESWRELTGIAQPVRAYDSSDINDADRALVMLVAKSTPIKKLVDFAKLHLDFIPDVYVKVRKFADDGEIRTIFYVYEVDIDGEEDKLLYEELDPQWSIANFYADYEKLETMYRG